MKDIHEILKGIGVEIPEDKQEEFKKEFFGNYKTVAELSQKDQQIQSLTDQLNTAKEGLKKFDGVDVEGLKGQISKLQSDLTAKDEEWQGKLADSNFNHLMDGTISSLKGKNAKAIKALLDDETMDSLKKSKNQEGDIKTALEAIKKDNDYLFESEGGAPGKYNEGGGNQHNNSEPGDKDIAAFMKGAGIEAKKE